MTRQNWHSLRRLMRRCEHAVLLPLVNLSKPNPWRFKTPFRVSRAVRHRTTYRIGPWSIFLWFQQVGATAHTAQISHACLQDNVSGQTHFSFWGHHLGHPLTRPCSTRLLPLGLHYKQGIQNTSCQYWLRKTANCGVYLRDPSGSYKTCYNSLSIATVDVYWTTW